MLAAGVLGNPLLGNLQDKEVGRILLEQDTTIHQQVMGESRLSLFGRYQPVDLEKLGSASPEVQLTVGEVQAEAKKSALRTVVVFPGMMLVSYIGLLLYFRSKGGYKPIVLEGG
ncbi:MAG: MFS transporter, partial [Planctomycetota bacterium]|jgi:hypothetical protein